MDSQTLLYAVPFCGVLALVYAAVRGTWIGKQDAGNDRMKTIAGHIRDGAMAFLKREYSVLAIFVVVVAALLAWANAGRADNSILIGVSVIAGALCSGAAGFFGMRVATAANVRTAAAARTGLNGALKVAFSGGAVMGFCVVGLGVLGLSTLYLVYSSIFMGEGGGLMKVINVLTGFSFGASSIALFARVGGGIFTKAADVGADLVGKVEAGIPEDDPRNPAVIADNVGDNVGDVAGMGADLFESYVGAIVGSLVLGGAASLAAGETSNVAPLVLLPLVLAGLGILVSLGGTFLVRTKEGGNPSHALHAGTLSSAVVMLIATFFVTRALVPGSYPLAAGGSFDAMSIFLATLAGLVAGVAIGMITEYYTSESRGPAQGVAKESLTGSATNIISGLALGMRSTALPVVVLVAAIIAAYGQAGLYGIAIAALGMLSTTGIQLAVDAYGPVADNAGGIAEMAHLGKEVRARTDRLDAVGNTTAAIGKGFAIGSAALTALALFAAFRTTVGLDVIDVANPKVMGGLFIGAMLPFLFSSMAMEAVGHAASAMIEEVRRQFKEIPGLLAGDENAVADYATCVDIATQGAIRQMVAPGVLAISVPVVVGFYDVAALGGVLAGVTSAGVMMAIFQSNAGGAWDNAKKYIEEGHHGGKGSDAHKASVVGDTVGDPFKDTSGPSINILIKLMSVVALVIAPLL